MGCHQADAAEQTAWRTQGQRPPRPQRHFLGVAVRSALAVPESFGSYTTCFVRWRRAGVWGKIMNALVGAHDAAVQIIDTSIVRLHQHGACIARNRRQPMGRSRGGLTYWDRARGYACKISGHPTTARLPNEF
jgi:transposase